MNKKIYGQVLDDIPDLVIVKNKDGDIIYKNKTMNKSNLSVYKNDVYLDSKNNLFYKKTTSVNNGNIIEIYTDITSYINLINYYSLDFLTRLPLRTKSIEHFNYTLGNNSAYAYALLDIDNFKHINDKYGHVVGDKVLMRIAEILKNSLVEDDFICRYGGEEFLYITKFNGVVDVVNKFNSIRKKISEVIYSFNGSTFSVTVSIGVSISKNNSNIEEIISNADKNLYYVKNHGKNNIFVTDNIVKENVKSGSMI